MFDKIPLVRKLRLDSADLCKFENKKYWVHLIEQER